MDAVARSHSTLPLWIGTSVALALIAAAILVPVITGIDPYVNSFPPLHAEWMPRIGWGTVPAIAVAVLAARSAVGLAARLQWDALLGAAFIGGLVWMLSLAFVDGGSGIGAILASKYEYLPTAERIDDVGAFLDDFIARIPIGSDGNWATHVAGHPPGATLFFWLLFRLGLGSWVSAGLLIILLAATAPLAVLTALRRLGAEDAARRAAPFLVMGPAAIWMATSADAMFTMASAWGLALLAIAATATRTRAMVAWSAAAGAVLGLCVFLSYGLPLLGVLAVAVLFLARSWWPLPIATGAALLVALAFGLGGFWWWEAFPVLVERYYVGAGGIRPPEYWIWANLAVLAVSAGPLVGASIAAAATRARPFDGWRRVAVVLTLVAAVVIMLADLSGMSRAEVERIWLPFVPWLLVGTALLPEPWRRWGFAGQLGFALVVQHLLFTGW
ncbi:membrane protein [Agromyces bauzanensis]|uniref:Membrane protein n=1 Tax=Agromyces bauzanensis TaxID=1308924 RepID=A0A917PI60_9MICO|nr:membrane protein [Agromyces bauzanensis]